MPVGKRDYSKGKIYRLVCNKTGLQYVGSCIQPLHKRKYGHISDYNKWKKGKDHFVSSFKILENNDWDIFIIEDYPCENNDQLRQRERYWHDTIENGCVNIVRPFITNEEETTRSRHCRTKKHLDNFKS